MVQTYEEIIDPNDLRNNQLYLSDRSFHDWYRFVLSFPPQLVRGYIHKFGRAQDSVILDPVCGTGTTIVEAKKNLIPAVGIEAIPMSHFASMVKTTWEVDTDQLRAAAEKILENLAKANENITPLRTFSPEQLSIILKNSICEIPLHKCLLLLEEIYKEENSKNRNLFLLALAYVSVHDASNLKFGPEVGVSRKKKADANVFDDWRSKVSEMADDLESVKGIRYLPTNCHLSDSRNLKDVLKKESIDAIITSPPYPNEKDYTRTTRLESVLLGFLKNKKELRNFKKTLLRSNTRNVYISDDDDLLIDSKSEISRIAQEIERRRIALNKTSGFERQYHRVTKLYFGGMKRHLAELRTALRPGAQLAYVVGDQASYLQVLIRTGELLAEIAQELGYEVSEIDLFRTRISTATGEQLREEVLVLEWQGSTSKLSNCLIDMASKKQNRYDRLIEKVFFDNYKEGEFEVSFDRKEFEDAAKDLNIQLPKNLGDIIYSYRYRNKLPKNITNLLSAGEEWVIRSAGRGKYLFAKSAIHRISPNPRLTKIKILDATPEIIRRYALNDEQALLAILRYNRLIDTFTGVTCYSLQSHLRTTVKGIGQLETDEIYVGVGKRGEQYVIPIQAKGKNDQIGIVQIEQDFSLCDSKFSALVCRPIAAQFIEDNLIALIEFKKINNEISIREERHYRIVLNNDLNNEEIVKYRENGE